MRKMTQLFLASALALGVAAPAAFAQSANPNDPAAASGAMVNGAHKHKGHRLHRAGGAGAARAEVASEAGTNDKGKGGNGP